MKPLHYRQSPIT